MAPPAAGSGRRPGTAVSRRLAALPVLAAAALRLAAGPAPATAAAAPASPRRLEPSVTVLPCEEGGGFVATNGRERRESCTGGEFDDHDVDGE
ncbi:hypothetical protein ACIRD3_11080 [Kitasatospora sp. NPDC093550]|uniref:hypothetical protein n=1 Tax=Kitasatospora sp. NPDC093550 TaxID=3364089 RepID=UPI00381907C8